MIHDPALLSQLEAFETQPFDGEVFRATRVSLDPPCGIDQWRAMGATRATLRTVYELEPGGRFSRDLVSLGTVDPFT